MTQLTFDGNYATTASGGPSERKGIEISNDLRPRPWLTLGADSATSTARFRDDPQRRCIGVPKSLKGVVSLGATVETASCAASLRRRYFGPRILDFQGDAKSLPSTLCNARYTARFGSGRRLSFVKFNLNADVADVRYLSVSRVPLDAAKHALGTNPAVKPALRGCRVNDFHFHPTVKRSVRLTYVVPF